MTAWSLVLVAGAAIAVVSLFTCMASLTGRFYSAPWTTGYAAYCANCFSHFTEHRGSRHGSGPWRCPR